MKYLIVLALVFSFSACCSQKKISETKTDSTEKISVSETVTKAKMGQLTSYGKTTIKLKEVNDSRCPEDVSCIWAGEARVVVGIYREGIFEKDVNIIFSPKGTDQENPLMLFKDNDNTYYAYGLSPYPSQKTKTEQKDYELLMEMKPKSDK